MKHVILAEPATLGLFGLGFMLLLMALVVVGVIGIVALVLGRKEKTAEPPIIPPGPSTAPVQQKCPKCGAPMPPDSPEGLCPRCLIALNLATQTDIPGEAHTAKAPAGPPLPVGDIAKLFPQLEILECLGRGGMGAVYKARQPRLDRIVALKILSPEKQGNQKFAERFEREARALAKLHHPNIVTVYDFGETQGNFYLLMEFVDGLTLRQLLQSRKLAPEEALAIVPKICEALQYAHGQGIVHRDIKPENVLMDKEGRIKIADFGIAKILGDGERTNLTEEQAIGTPHYMSPEQIERPQMVDHRADIYSLGVVFYEMLTGELPLGKFQPPSKKVHVDVRLDEIVLRALEKEPERRYQQASEVKTRVENIAATAPMMVAPEQSAKKPDHFWRWFAVICLSLIAIPFLIAIFGILMGIAIPAFVRGRHEAQRMQQMEDNNYYAGQSWFPLGDDIEITGYEFNGAVITVRGRYTLNSHPNAFLELGITSERDPGVADKPAQFIYINQGRGEFSFNMTRATPGLPHISMYADGHSFAALYFGKASEVAQEKKMYDSMMNDPVALWLANGDATDSAHGHDGVPVNVSFTKGVVGSAFAFHPESNPVGAYSGIKIPDDPALAATNAFSIEGWIKPTGLGYVIFWRGDNRPGTDPYSVSMDNTRLKFTICDEADNDAWASAQIAYDQWWHFAAVYDNGTLTLYTNGVIAAETNTMIRPFGRLMESESPGVGIGNLNDGGNNFPFRGDIDDIAFYNRALSPLEVRFNYEVGFKNARTEATPVVPPPVVTSGDLENANTNHPKVIWVSPADGASDVNTQHDIHIRFDQPMNPNDIVVNWRSGGFLANGEPHYDAGKNEFIVPVQLLADRTNIVQVNWVSGGFRSTNGIPADEYKWQFTTKALATNPDAPKPKVVDVSPGGGETLPVLTMLELTFDQPMTLDRGLPYLRGTGSAFVPAMISDFHYDATGRRLTIPLILPPDNETKLTLEGLYSADGAASDPVVVRCDIGTNNYSSQQLADISAAAQDPRLEQLLSAMQEARAHLASGVETVTGTSLSQMQDSLRRFTVYPATFKWQGTNEYYEDISDIMECKAFILGTDGKNCWIYSDDQYSGRRFDSSPRAAMADFFASVADPFNLAHNSVPAAIAKGKLMYDGQAQLDGHNCYCVKCWLVEQTGNEYFPVDASRCEWWIDAETYLPVQVAVNGGEKEIYQFHYTGLNQPLPITAFQPPGTQGALPLDWYQLSPKETRFFTIKDGSDGQMSGRIGKRGPNGGSTSCGLN